eukprot:Blabericola_migrator_1__3975@NODE_2202_length_3135_cov_17_385593_g556_i1_p1_GENE_NODE_2202_length_3135_cov_17_385593_g556_i1NODE_2202_length_3135_cov_17_385593_g556_i1_p1_ORF_typecomplete_len294_score8_86_NODE_2202_length_3135_cov_17_385593_g556_i13151196
MQSTLTDRMYTLIRKHAKHFHPQSMQRIVIPKTCRALPSRRMQSTEFTALSMQCERPLSRKRTTHSQHAHHPHPTSCKAFLPTGCTLSSESTPSTSSLTTCTLSSESTSSTSTLTACTSLPPQQHAKHSRPHSMQRIVIPKTCRALPSRRMQSTEFTTLLMQCERSNCRNSRTTAFTDHGNVFKKRGVVVFIILHEPLLVGGQNTRLISDYFFVALSTSKRGVRVPLRRDFSQALFLPRQHLVSEVAKCSGPGAEAKCRRGRREGCQQPERNLKNHIRLHLLNRILKWSSTLL